MHLQSPLTYLAGLHRLGGLQHQPISSGIKMDPAVGSSWRGMIGHVHCRGQNKHTAPTKDEAHRAATGLQKG